MRERTPFPRALFERLPNLRLLATTGMRNAAIDLAAATAAGVIVSGTGASGAATAELTWGLILGLARHIAAEAASVRSGGWQTSVGGDLGGRTLGVIGLGRLGSKVASIGNAFGMTVIAWSPNLTQDRARECGAALVSKDALLASSDIVTIHMVLSETTRGLLGAAELARMKPSALLINTSRGPLIDEAALVAALAAGKLASAGLDVFDVEPLAADHPLRRLDNVLVTPHIGFVTQATYEIFFRQTVENIAAYLDGAPIRVIPAG